MMHSKSATRARLADARASAGQSPGGKPAHCLAVAPDAQVARARGRQPAAELILLHRLRARAAAAAGRPDHAHRVIELTARAWLG